ncbi:MAG: Rho termination factor N-terminal domain-containing protein [Actinomycetes bacterium]
MSKDEPGNQTPGTPDLSESDLREMKVDELRERAKQVGIGSTSSMKKDELVKAISTAHGKGGKGGGKGDSGEAESRGDSEDAGGGEAGKPGDAGPEGGRIRTGDDTSKSLKYSQEITSPDDEPERAGRSLATTSHEVIRQWAEARDGVPATVEGTEHGEHLGVLRFDFGGDDERLRHVSWDEWFDTFDARKLNFLYQQERKDGRQSNFFRLESPEREDA